MKVKRAKISNWKSFPYSETPDWMEFKKLNIFIGPNSHGKTNYVNALRYVLFGNIDTNNVPRDHGLPECNMPDEPIRIDVDVSTSDNPNIELRVQHSFEEFNEVLIKKNLNDNKIGGKFFPLGAGRKINTLGHQDASDVYGGKNWELIRDRWGEIRDDMAKFFGVDLRPEAPKNPDNKEIYLNDMTENNGKPLLEIGSGIMAVLFLIMEIYKHPSRIGCNVFLFEEPENHMHPSLLRKFLVYITSLIKDKEMQFFITTHSSVLIDKSILSDEAAVFQIRKKAKHSKITNISNDRKGLIDVLYCQLGYKPSDILLANTVIWVEGPSDMIYLRHWLKERAKDLEEGKDFTIMFNGGSLIKHLSFEEDIDIDGLIDLSTINVNSVIMMDSDIEYEGDTIGDNQAKVERSFDDNGGLVWITEGREVENYIQCRLLKQAVEEEHPDDKKYYKVLADPDKYGRRTALKTLPNTNKKVYIRKVNIAKRVVELQVGGGIPTDFDILKLGESLDRLKDWIKSKR